MTCKVTSNKNATEIPKTGGFWTDISQNHKIFLNMSQAEEYAKTLKDAKNGWFGIATDVAGEFVPFEMLPNTESVVIKTMAGVAMTADQMALRYANVRKLFTKFGMKSLSASLEKFCQYYTAIKIGYIVLDDMLDDKDIDDFIKVVNNSKGKSGFIIINLVYEPLAPSLGRFSSSYCESEYTTVNTNPFRNYMRNNYGSAYDEDDDGIVSLDYVPSYYQEVIEHCLYHY